MKNNMVKKIFFFVFLCSLFESSFSAPDFLNNAHKDANLELLMLIEEVKPHDDNSINAIVFYIEDDEFIVTERYVNGENIEKIYTRLNEIKSEIKKINIIQFDYSEEKEKAYEKKKQIEKLEFLVTSGYGGRDIRINIPTNNGDLVICDQEALITIRYLSEYSENFKKISNLFDLLALNYGLSVFRTLGLGEIDQK